MTTLLSDRYKKALDLVAVLFKHEKRKVTGVPYIVHLVGVAYITSQLTDDEDVLIAALLHDVLEDIPQSEYDEFKMRKDFGDKVTDIVNTVTHEEAKDGYEGSRKAYLKQIKSGSIEACIVSAADLLYNLQDSLETYIKYPRLTEKMFKGDRARIRNKFHEDRFKILKDRLGDDNPVIEDLKDIMPKVSAIYKEYLVK